MDVRRYVIETKQALVILVALLVIVIGQKWMSDRTVNNDHFSAQWKLHAVPEDGASAIKWQAGHSVNLGFSESQLQFRVRLNTPAAADYISVSPAYMDQVEVVFYDAQGNLLGRQVKGDKVLAFAGDGLDYSYDLDQLVFSTPNLATHANIKIHSSEQLQAAIKVMSSQQLFADYRTSLIFKSIMLFIVVATAMSAAIMSLMLGQKLLGVFAVHQLVWAVLLASMSGFLPSVMPHLNVANGYLLGALPIVTVISGACFHWHLLRPMVRAKWLGTAILVVILMSVLNLVIYLWLDEQLGRILNVVTMAVMILGLIVLVWRSKPVDRMQGFIMKRVRLLYGFFMLLVVAAAVTRLGVGENVPSYAIYVYALVSMLVLASIVWLRTSIMQRRRLNLANKAMLLTRSNERLGKDLAEQTALLSMLSHEIKTPLTTLNFCVENAPHKELMNTQLANIQHVVDKVELMGSLSSSFESFEQVYLLEMIRQQWQSSRWNEQHDHQLHLLKRGNIDYQGNHLALEVIFNDLLSNAQKYGIGERVQVSVIGLPKGICVRIKNMSHKLEASSLRALTDKYYRAPNVGGIRGTGLGLWVVQNLCIANNYHFKVQQKRGLFIATLRLAL